MPIFKIRVKEALLGDRNTQRYLPRVSIADLIYHIEEIQKIVASAYHFVFDHGPEFKDVCVIYDDTTHLLVGPDLLCDLIASPHPDANDQDYQSLCWAIAEKIAEMPLTLSGRSPEVCVRFIAQKTVGSAAVLPDQGTVICTNYWPKSH